MIFYPIPCPQIAVTSLIQRLKCDVVAIQIEYAHKKLPRRAHFGHNLITVATKGPPASTAVALETRLGIELNWH